MPRINVQQTIKSNASCFKLHSLLDHLLKHFLKVAQITCFGNVHEHTLPVNVRLAAWWATHTFVPVLGSK